MGEVKRKRTAEHAKTEGQSGKHEILILGRQMLGSRQMAV
jgi:hypothetical protein